MQASSIQLELLVPEYLEKDKLVHSQVWNTRLHFRIGERIQIVAPSGSGKTSLVHMIYGLRKDFSGAVLCDGKPLKSFNPQELASWRKNRISVVFQDLRLFPDQTAERNIEVKRLLQPYHNVSKVTEMAKRLGVYEKLRQTAQTCSYGEQQRIAIIRALQQPFDFLLLDEPFSHLDDRNAERALSLIEEECTARGAAILMIDLQEVPFFKAERTLHL
ncbi:MAG: ATP-binding cassette domain-containing protein [Ferruginibacter sp.]|nr:ATP-binding cassette domain-containing protein [Ferruginibacter sp.]